MEGVEGGLGDETSQMSIDIERASDMDSAAQQDDLQRTLHPSRLEKPAFGSYDRLLELVRSLLESGYWDHILPGYEKQVLLVATSTPGAWQHFLDSTAIPSSAALNASAYPSAQSSSSSSSTRKGAAAVNTKVQKPVTRSRRGTSTPRRRGADTEAADTTATDSTQETQYASREYTETLHTRLRTLIFDTLVDEILFPHERHLELVPVNNAIKQGTLCTLLGPYVSFLSILLASHAAAPPSSPKFGSLPSIGFFRLTSPFIPSTSFPRLTDSLNLPLCAM